VRHLLRVHDGNQTRRAAGTVHSRSLSASPSPSPSLLPPSRYPEGIKLITASIGDHFGTYYGSLLQDWCKHWGWALAWVLRDATTVLDGRRLLDPTVLPSTTVNVTLGPAVLPAFQALWTAANTTPPAAGNYTYFENAWAAYVNETNTPGVGQTLTWNIGVRDCEDYDNCFGLAHTTGTCVCYINRTDF
jgi:hypothetical protein